MTAANDLCRFALEVAGAAAVVFAV